MIYTSYFGKLKKLPENVIPVAICAKTPEWYAGLQYKKLAPKYGFFMEWKKTHDNDYYIKHFNEEVLDVLNVNDVLNEIRAMLPEDKKNTDIALICYEKSGDFCHRYLVSLWLNKHGIESKEF